MKCRDYLFLFVLALGVLLPVAAFQQAPGYLDADYYYATGLQLAQGNGFREPFLWNYLDDPPGLPHPSHAYWMPLASLLAALIPAFFSDASWFLARLPFFLLAALVPPLTAALAFALHANRSFALTSGLLAAFSGLYLPFLTTTDTFGVYMFLGGLFFVVLARREVQRSVGSPFLLGMVTGLMHLARTEGLFWFFFALLGIWLLRGQRRLSLVRFARAFVALLAGYLTIMAPWFARNLAAFGQILAPGGSKMLWLTAYDQIFAYPADFLTWEHWLASGWQAILRARSWAFGLNLATLLVVQGGVFLFPLALSGGWHLRRDPLVHLALFAWLVIFLLMTVLFPFAGARGGYFHASAAFQPMLWALVPAGLEKVLQAGRRYRGWEIERARPVFRFGLLSLAIVLTGMALFLRLPTWNAEAQTYRKVAALLGEAGARPEEVVIVSNPPGFYLASGLAAIAVPDGQSETILQLARRYGASYLILEEGSLPQGLVSLYQSEVLPPGIVLLAEFEGGRVYDLQP